LKVKFRNWREEEFTLEFEGVVAFQHHTNLGDLDQAIESRTGEYLERVVMSAQLLELTEKSISQLKCFTFDSISTIPALQIIAKDYRIVSAEENQS
jgi:hypothetical protein